MHSSGSCITYKILKSLQARLIKVFLKLTRIIHDRHIPMSLAKRYKIYHTRRQPRVSLMFLPHFDVLCDLFTEQAHGNMESICFIQKRNKLLQLFLFQNLSQLLESRPTDLKRTRKKPFDVICCLYKMKQSHWLLWVAKNCDWSRKITPLSNLTPEGVSWNENLQRRQN